VFFIIFFAFHNNSNILLLSFTPMAIQFSSHSHEGGSHSFSHITNLVGPTEWKQGSGENCMSYGYLEKVLQDEENYIHIGSVDEKFVSSD
jgi:hypothetical protein